MEVCRKRRCIIMSPAMVVRITNTRDVLEDTRLRTVALAGGELVTTVHAGELGGCNRLDDSGGGVKHCLSLGAGFIRRGCKGYILEVDITTSDIPWLYSRRVTCTEVGVWWVEIVPMYMVAGTGMAAGLVAYWEVHRVVRG